jgi:DNA polymerase III subunit delta'
MEYPLNDEIIGHGALRAFLARSLVRPRHHAYLLVGPEKSGKDTVARAFVGGLIGKKIDDWNEIAANADIVVLKREEDKKLIGVMELRAFQSRFQTSAFGGGVKIGVIVGAHELSIEAANAFLKTLEEPPGRSIFILIADDISKIPATIASRSAILRFLPVSERELVAGLVARGYERARARAVAREANGLPGLAISLLSDRKAALAREGGVNDFLDFAARPLAARVSRAAAFAEEKNASSDLGAMFDLWLSVLRDAVLIKSGNADLVGNAVHEERISAFAKPLGMDKIRGALTAVISGKKMLSANVNSRLIIENIALAL